jgi:hypothetical protein
MSDDFITHWNLEFGQQKARFLDILKRDERSHALEDEGLATQDHSVAAV